MSQALAPGAVGTVAVDLYVDVWFDVIGSVLGEARWELGICFSLGLNPGFPDWNISREIEFSRIVGMRVVVCAV